MRKTRGFNVSLIGQKVAVPIRFTPCIVVVVFSTNIVNKHCNLYLAFQLTSQVINFGL